jgi:hypothetical protein
MAHMTRRPMCPYCEYDLSGTYDRFARGDVRCSECGERFEHHEVYWSGRPGDWTWRRGLVNLLVSLCWRMTVALLLIVGSIWLIEAFGNWLAGQTASGFRMSPRVYFLPMIAVGVSVGYVLIRNLPDAVGVESWFLAWIAALGAGATVFIAGPLVQILIGPSYVHVEWFLLFVIVLAGATIVWWYYEHAA